MGIKTISSFFGHVVSLPNTLRLSSNVKAASLPPRPADGLACELRADKALRRTPPAPVSFPRSPAVPPQGAGSAHGSCPSNTALGPHRPCRGRRISAGRSVPGARSLPPPRPPPPKPLCGNHLGENPRPHGQELWSLLGLALPGRSAAPGSGGGHSVLRDLRLPGCPAPPRGLSESARHTLVVFTGKP